MDDPRTRRPHGRRLGELLAPEIPEEERDRRHDDGPIDPADFHIREEVAAPPQFQDRGTPPAPTVDDLVEQTGVPLDEQAGAGRPDAFRRLWTPHRMAYIKRDDGGGCPFCGIPDLTDADGLVVTRAEFAYAVLNLYPYNPGHLMLVPYRHVSDITDLTEDELAQVNAMTRTAVRVLRRVSAPHGFNVGLNLGAAAGAGIAEHLHQHVVPRWVGDTNFMPVAGHTRVLPQLLTETRDLLSAAWGEIVGEGG
jgi:ATP adenylyltransferase